MTIQQISVFLENKTGRVNQVTKVLAAHGINMVAFSIAENADFGILRLIVSDVEKTVEVLRNADFAVILTDVVCLNCKNVPGALSSVLEALAAQDIFIEYMYAFADAGSANVIIKPTDLERCEQVVNGIQ